MSGDPSILAVTVSFRSAMRLMVKVVTEQFLVFASPSSSRAPFIHKIKLLTLWEQPLCNVQMTEMR